jgi:predicted NBD/HSP70 family sugar kinase
MPEDIRENNIRTILRQFLSNDRLTISDLEIRTGISKTTILKIVSQLIDSSVLSGLGKAAPSEDKGRRPNIYAVNNTYRYIIVSHIFSNEVCTAVTDLRNQIISADSVPIVSAVAFDDMIDVLVHSIRQMMNREGIGDERIEAICIAASGSVDHHSGSIIYAPRFPNWPHYAPLKEKIQSRFPKSQKIIVENEMRFQTLAEQIFGKAHSDSIVLDAGDKLVAGIINHQSLVRGAHSVAGEIGHMILDPNSDIQCVCGAYGCFLAMVSVKRALSMVTEKVGDYPDSPLYKTRRNLKMTDLFEAYENGDALGSLIMDDIAKWFGLGLSNMILMYDPGSIIIQGIYAKAGQKFLDQIKNFITWGKFPLLKGLGTNIEYSGLDKNAGIIGGSVMGSQDFLRDFNITSPLKTPLNFL